jgi:outer membrane protein
MARVSVVLVVSLWAAVAAAQNASPSTSPPKASSPVPASAAVQAGQPLSFEDAVNAAERAAESVTVARSEVDRAQAGVSTARSGYLPTVNGSASYQRTLSSQFDDISFGPPPMGMEDTVDALPFGQPNNWNVGVQLSQPLFDGFRTRAGLRQAKAGVRVAKLGVQSTKAQVVLQVAQAYLDAALAQRQVEIAEVTLQQAEQTFNETQLGFKQGATPEFDLVRAEVARDNQKTLLVQFQVQRDVTLVYLRRLIGVPVEQPLSLTTKLDGDDVEAVVGAARGAAGIVATERVAVAQAKEGVALREAAVDAAKADRLPTIAAVSDLGFVNYEKQPFNNEWFTNWTVGVAVQIPIFDGFRRRSHIQATQAQLSGARAQLTEAHEVSQVEAAQARASVEASLKQLEASVRTVKQAQRAYQIAELRFQQGASTHLELVDTRVQLEQALLNQAKSARDLRVARLRQELLPGLPLGAAAGF